MTQALANLHKTSKESRDQTCQLITVRSNHQRCSIKKSALKNFAIFTGKHLCLSHFSIKLEGFKPLEIYHIEAIKLLCKSMDWVYMIGTFVIKELKHFIL